MNRLTLIQHHPAEGPGAIAEWAKARLLSLEIYRADLGALPVVSAAPILLLGGPYPVDAGPVWLQRERAWLREVLAARAPIFGICLGAQLLADALGGSVFTLPEPENGWAKVRFDDGSTLEVLHWHDDNFSIPHGAQLHASSALCANQMFSVGEHLIGVQFHPEWNAASVATLNAYFGDSSPLPHQGDADAARHQAVAVWLHARLDRWRRSWRIL
jgi:GMP synthase-like glutamine amidotransferase